MVNLKTATVVLKGVHLGLALMVMLMGRVISGAATFSGATTNYVPYGDPTIVDELILGDMVAYGFFYIILAQTMSIALGEEPLKLHLIFDTVGGLSYLVMGSLHLAFWVGDFNNAGVQAMIAAGALAIVTGLALLCGTVVWFLRIRKGD